MYNSVLYILTGITLTMLLFAGLDWYFTGEGMHPAMCIFIAITQLVFLCIATQDSYSTLE